MKIGGYGIKAYLHLLKPLFWFVAAVWALRLVLAAANAPLGLVKIVSVTAAAAVSFLLASGLIHAKRFGSYSHVIVAVLLIAIWAQSLIAAAIVFSVLTGWTNIYTAPEFSHGMTTTQHLVGHLTFEVGFTTLFGSAMGCLLLWALRTFVPMEPHRGPSR